MKRKLSNWGNYPVVDTDISNIPTDPADCKKDEHIPWTLRGMGRSYGDASLGKYIRSTLTLNCMLSFDTDQGLLVAESGVTLQDVLEVIVPRGYFLPVTPGTKFVSLGGAVAADVHGKNHHCEGSFCAHVEWIELMPEPGRILRCSVNENQEWFETTCGGMGLTGLILKVALRLKKIETAWISQQKYKAENFNALCDLFEVHGDSTYSVAWVDCLAKGKHLGRSIIMLGEHTTALELQKERPKLTAFPKNQTKNIKVPVFLPGALLNKTSIGLFNQLYFTKQSISPAKSICHYESYFYPLDALLHWNRIYGKKGFIQYQFVLPFSGGKEAMMQILKRISDKGYASFLTVLKVMGKQSGVLAFPMEGYTLALDFPLSKGLLHFLTELDAMVLAAGGRIYLAKDARMSARMFHESYGPAATKFKSQLSSFNTQNLYTSYLAERLEIR